MRKKETLPKPDSETTKHQTPTINIKTPRKQNPQSQSKKVVETPIKNFDGSQEILSLSDKEELLLLQIKQLKRENNFLKKKISELTSQSADRIGSKRQINKEKRVSSPSCLEVVPLSIEVVFEEINNVLNTIVKLFKLEFTDKEISDYNTEENSKETGTIKSHLLFKKCYLKQKLERIALEEEEKRLPILLDLFRQYYKEKEDYDRTIIRTVDDLIVKTHELNELILKKVQEKKKTKGTFSTINNESEQRIPIESLKSPPPTKNFIAQNKIIANSPLTNRNGKKTNRFPMSPSEKIRQNDV